MLANEQIKTSCFLRRRRRSSAGVYLLAARGMRPRLRADRVSIRSVNIPNLTRCSAHRTGSELIRVAKTNKALESGSGQIPPKTCPAPSFRSVLFYAVPFAQADSIRSARAAHSRPERQRQTTTDSVAHSPRCKTALSASVRYTVGRSGSPRARRENSFVVHLLIVCIRFIFEFTFTFRKDQHESRVWHSERYATQSAAPSLARKANTRVTLCQQANAVVTHKSEICPIGTDANPFESAL